MATIFRDTSVEYVKPRGVGRLRLRLQQVPPPAPREPSRPSRVDMVSVLVSKHQFSEDQASMLIDLLTRVRDFKPRATRRCSCGLAHEPLREHYVLSHDELVHCHHLLRVAVPARVTNPERGSAHDVLSRGLLEPGMVFEHGMTDDQCAVIVRCTSS